jgi:hypothetical protein
MTHLKLTDVSNNTEFICNRFAGNLQSIENMFKDDIVMRKISENALKM